MANKRYDEFGAGTYDTAKIFLQADSATGALEKVNLPLPGARYCKFSASVLINANNSGSNPQTAATITLPANTMNAAGDTILIKFFIRYITAAGTKTVTISSAIIDTATVTSTAANQYEFIVFGSRIDSTHMLNYFRATSITSSIPFSNFASKTCDFTINNNIDFKVTAGAANDIFLAWAEVKVFAAA